VKANFKRTGDEREFFRIALRQGNDEGWERQVAEAEMLRVRRRDRGAGGGGRDPTCDMLVCVLYIFSCVWSCVFGPFFVKRFASVGGMWRKNRDFSHISIIDPNARRRCRFTHRAPIDPFGGGHFLVARCTQTPMATWHVGIRALATVGFVTNDTVKGNGSMRLLFHQLPHAFACLLGAVPAFLCVHSNALLPHQAEAAIQIIFKFSLVLEGAVGPKELSVAIALMMLPLSIVIHGAVCQKPLSVAMPLILLPLPIVLEGAVDSKHLSVTIQLILLPLTNEMQGGAVQPKPLSVAIRLILPPLTIVLEGAVGPKRIAVTVALPIEPVALVQGGGGGGGHRVPSPRSTSSLVLASFFVVSRCGFRQSVWKNSIKYPSATMCQYMMHTHFPF